MSLWMGENDARHEEARGPTRRRLCCTPSQNFSQRERDVEECHRRVGRVGPEHRSSRRGRGEQRRPLLRRPQRSERYIVKRLRETHTLFALLDFGTHRTLYALALPLGSRSLVSNPLSRTSESRARRCLLVDRASLYAMSERERMIKLRVGPSRPDCERDF